MKLQFQGKDGSGCSASLQTNRSLRALPGRQESIPRRQLSRQGSSSLAGAWLLRQGAPKGAGNTAQHELAAGRYNCHAQDGGFGGCHHFYAVYADVLPASPSGWDAGGVGCEGTRGASRAETVIAESPPRANTKTPDSALCPQPVTCGQHVTAAQALQRTPGCRPLLGQ